MLFADISEIRKYVNVTPSLTLETIQPDIERTENQIIKKYLGKVQFDELVIEYGLHSDDISEMEDRLKALLEKVRPAIALLSVYRAAKILSVQISDSGFQMISSENYKQAFSWMKNDAAEYLVQYGYIAIDELIEFLEENIDDYPFWAEDESAYTLNKKFIVSSAKEFNDAVNISESRLTYMAFESILKRIEMFKISPAISSELYAELKEEIAAADVSEDNQKLLEYLRPACALFAAAKGLFELPLQISEKGVVMNFSRAFQSDTNKETKVADASDRAAVAARWEQDGQTYLLQCIQYLNQNASQSHYASFYSSNQYKGTSSTAGIPFKNESTQKNFGFF